MEGELRFSMHAVVQMGARHISDLEVREALNNQTRERPGRPGRVVRFGITSGGRTLKIVQPVDDPSLVVTVMAKGEWP